jgi:hypothetical protein
MSKHKYERSSIQTAGEVMNKIRQQLQLIIIQRLGSVFLEEEFSSMKCIDLDENKNENKSTAALRNAGMKDRKRAEKLLVIRICSPLFGQLPH